MRFAFCVLLVGLFIDPVRPLGKRKTSKSYIVKERRKQPNLILASAAIILTLAGCYPAQWSRGDTARQVVLTGLLTADAAQTIPITKRCLEMNPIIGLCGKRVHPLKYFFAAIVVHTAAVWVVPKEYREAFQYTAIGLESAVISMNYFNRF